jgi:hypothetical protein
VAAEKQGRYEVWGLRAGLRSGSTMVNPVSRRSEAVVAIVVGVLALVGILAAAAAPDGPDRGPSDTRAAATLLLAPVLALAYNGWVAVAHRKPWRWVAAAAAALATVPAIGFLSERPPPSHGSCPAAPLFPSFVGEFLEPAIWAVAIVGIPAALLLLLLAWLRPQTRPVALWTSGLLVLASINAWAIVYGLACGVK